MNGSLFLLQAIDFAARKHKHQRRKDEEASPYINHPVYVALLLAEVGKITDPEILAAAILHDTIEDTETAPEELEANFGPRVRKLVEEVSDDKSRTREVRKQLQIDHAPELSPEATQIKLADKIANIVDITCSPPKNWPLKRKTDYLDWAERVVRNCPKVNPALAQYFADVVTQARKALPSEN